MAKKKNDGTSSSLRTARAAEMAKERDRKARKERLGLSGVIIAVVIALIAIASWGVSQEAKRNKAQTDLLTPKHSSIEAKTFGINYTPKDVGYKGNIKPVKVVLYEDFQCPACKQFEEVAGEILNNLVKSGKLSIEYRMVSFLDESGASPNEYSRRMASAAICALDAGGPQSWKKVHDYAYKNQPRELTLGPTNRALLKTVKEIEPKVNEDCVISGRYVPWMDEATAEFNASGISGTPGAIINGKKLSAEEILPEIDKLLSAKK